jgi:hypothetical protein
MLKGINASLIGVSTISYFVSSIAIVVDSVTMFEVMHSHVHALCHGVLHGLTEQHTLNLRRSRSWSSE